MSETANRQSVRIDQFFAGPGARGDQWRDLVELADAALRDHITSNDAHARGRS